MGMRVGVGRGVIVIMIGMTMARVIRVIVGSVWLRWGMAINMVVILVILKSLRSVYELENDQSKNGVIRGSGREQRVGGSGVAICQDYSLPLCPHTNWPWLDE